MDVPVQREWRWGWVGPPQDLPRGLCEGTALVSIGRHGSAVVYTGPEWSARGWDLLRTSLEDCDGLLAVREAFLLYG